jgi:hypothetical protein
MHMTGEVGDLPPTSDAIRWPVRRFDNEPRETDARVSRVTTKRSIQVMAVVEQ